MAIENAKTLNVRIKNKYDSYENWAASGLVLEAGEIAIAYSTVDVQVDNGTAKHPFLLMKVGDGEKTFANLPWLSAKAADVLEAVKSEAGLTAFIKSVISAEDGDLADLIERVDAAEDDIDALQAELDTAETGLKARMTTAEDDIEAIEGRFGADTVAAEIATALASYSTTTQMNTAISTAKGEAITHADGLNTAMNTRVEALEAIDHDHANKTVLDGITADKVAAWDAAEQNAKGYADGLNTAMDGRVDALEAKFTGDDSVANQIADAVAAEAELREAADEALQNQIGVASAEGVAATGLHARIEELEDLTGGEKVSDAIAKAVSAEAEIARAAEKANANAINVLNGNAATAGSVDYKVAQAVAAIMENPDETMNSINELVTWVNGHATDALKMSNQVEANKTALETLNGDATKVGSVDKKIADAIAAEDLSQYATDGELSSLANRVTTIETEHNAESTGLKARLTQAEADIDDLETKVGDKTVSEQITDVTNPLADRVSDLEKVDHSHANATELDKFVDGDKAKLDAAVQTVTAAADSGLKATKTGTDVAIEIDDSITWVFDCGNSGVTA